MPPTRRNFRSIFMRAMLIAIAVLFCDQISKHIALHFLASRPFVLTPFLQFHLGFNHGAAFGVLHDAGGWQRYFLSGLAAGISIALVGWLWVARRRMRGALWMGLAALLGGAAGNLCDRIQYGYVVDFIVLHYRGWQFPAFNIADMAITLGAALLILDSLQSSRVGRR